MLCLIEGIEGFVSLRREINRLKADAESCSRQLRSWADSLQNPELKGTRYLNDGERRKEADRKRAAAFQEKLQSLLPEGHPAPEKARATAAARI